MKNNECKNCTYEMAGLCRMVNSMNDELAEKAAEIGFLRLALTKALGYPPESRSFIINRRNLEGSMQYFLDKLDKGEITDEMFVLMIKALMEVNRHE